MSSAADEFWIQSRMNAENVDQQYEDMLAGVEVRCACMPARLHCTHALSLGALARLSLADCHDEQGA